MKLTFEYKKTHINVYGNTVNLFGILGRRKLGKIKYDPCFGEYVFDFGVVLLGVCESTIKEINDKIKELRTRREKRGQ